MMNTDKYMNASSWLFGSVKSQVVNNTEDSTSRVDVKPTLFARVANLNDRASLCVLGNDKRKFFWRATDVLLIDPIGYLIDHYTQDPKTKEALKEKYAKRVGKQPLVEVDLIKVAVEYGLAQISIAKRKLASVLLGLVVYAYTVYQSAAHALKNCEQGPLPHNCSRLDSKHFFACIFFLVSIILVYLMPASMEANSREKVNTQLPKEFQRTKQD